MVSELVAHYGGNGPVDLTPRLTELLRPVGLVLGGALAAWLAWGWLSRRAARRLAATTPSAWWPCHACHSLNPAGTAACYRCGAAWTDEAASMPTAEHPETPQRFGRDKWGRDKLD
jgi:hypothetical protein